MFLSVTVGHHIEGNAIEVQEVNNGMPMTSNLERCFLADVVVFVGW